MNHPLDPTLTAQAQALVAQMTLAEKADFCSGKDFWHLPGLARLDIPSIMVTDGPHGLRKQGQNADHLGAHRSIPATCFPTASALASSWDLDLMHEVGVALGQTCVDEDVSVLHPDIHKVTHRDCEPAADPLVGGGDAVDRHARLRGDFVGPPTDHCSDTLSERRAQP